MLHDLWSQQVPALLAWLRCLAAGWLVSGVVAIAQDPQQAGVPVSIGQIQQEVVTRSLAGAKGASGFISNDGQWSSEVRFAASGRDGAAAWVFQDGFALRKRHPDDPARWVVVRLHFEESSPLAVVRGAEPQPGLKHFLIGRDTARWARDVITYHSVRIEGLYAGVDLLLRLEGGRLHYDLHLASGASPDGVIGRWAGIDGLRMAPEGAMLIETEAGPIHQSAPVAWESVEGEKEPFVGRRQVAVTTRALGELRFGFEMPSRNLARPLVIDPGLDWATYLGGTHLDALDGIDLTRDGSIVVGGQSASLDYPVTHGVFQTEHAPLSRPPGIVFGYDMVVTKLNADASEILWSTFIGGTGNHHDIVNDIHVMPDDEVIVGGWTPNADFPTTAGAYKEVLSLSDMVVLRLTADGTALVYSTFIGGESSESMYSMAVAPSGVVTVACQTNAVNYPTTPGAFQETDPSPFPRADVAVSRLSADGSHLLASTYLGGSLGATSPRGLALGPDDSVYVSANTNSPDFPTTPGAYKTSLSGVTITRFDPTLSTLIYSTFSAGGGPRALAVDSAGSVIAVGLTGNPDFPATPGALQPTYKGNQDGYVLRLDPTGSSLLYATFLGGSGVDNVLDVEFDSAGVATVVGTTVSANFPVTPGAYDATLGLKDFFVARIAPDGTALWYSTFVGGSGEDGSVGDATLDLVLDDEGNAYVASITHSIDFPVTPGAYDTTIDGENDGVIFKLAMLPAGTDKYGKSTPGCVGALAIGVTAMPQVGSVDFGLTCTNAGLFPAPGFLVLGAAALASPVPAKGAQMWVDPFSTLVLFPVKANAVGFAKLPLRIPDEPLLAGATMFGQFFFGSACTLQGWSASNALAITIQP